MPDHTHHVRWHWKSYGHMFEFLRAHIFCFQLFHLEISLWSKHFSCIFYESPSAYVTLFLLLLYLLYILKNNLTWVYLESLSSRKVGWLLCLWQVDRPRPKMCSHLFHFLARQTQRAVINISRSGIGPDKFSTRLYKNVLGSSIQTSASSKHGLSCAPCSWHCIDLDVPLLLASLLQFYARSSAF